MSYNNLLYLLVVIFLVTAGPDATGFGAGGVALVSLWLAKLGGLYLLCRLLFSSSRVYNPASYMRADRFGSFLAIVSIGLDVYYFHGLYYLTHLPGVHLLPIFAHIIGVCCFFFYMTVVWFVACRSHNLAFGRQGEPRSFIIENIRANLPIALPWMVVSIWVDGLKALPIAWLHKFMVDGYGEFAVFGLFFFFLALVFPPLLMKLWRCQPLPPGGVRDAIIGMCARLDLQYRDVLMWPLFGGQVLTAGVVGFVARFRYILLTEGLLANLTADEVEAVIAHETGHVKYYHMYLYLFVLLGFSMIIAPVLCGVNYIVLQMDWAYKLMESLHISVARFVELSETVVLFVSMIVFLRFVFGFFMRNFERQADLHAFSTTGGSRFIASSLEKVALLSGDIRDLPSWHHFGVGQRVDFLLDCEEKPHLVQRHHNRVRAMLVAYGLLILVSIAGYSAIPDDYLDDVLAVKIEETLMEELAGDPYNPDIHWLLADFYYRQKEFGQAISSYTESLRLNDANPEVHNNLAWLLVRCEDPAFRDPARGLRHAERAVTLLPAPHILDTYAHALWLNGYYEQAIQAEKAALDQTENPDYQVEFRQQIEAWKAERGDLFKVTRGVGI